MRKPSSVLAIAVVAVAVAICLVSCGGPGAAPPPNVQPPTTVRVSGAWALYPLMLRWAQEYQKVHPDIQVGVWSGGTGRGFTDLFGGAVDIAMASRAVTPEEESRGAFAVPVARDAVVLIASARNPVAGDLATRGLTREQCAGLWLSRSSTTWGALVSRPEVKDPVRVYVRSDVCGAAEAWAQYLGKRQTDLVGTGVYGDPQMAEAVAGDALAIGFLNLSYAYSPDTGKPAAGLLVVPLDVDGDRQIGPDESFYATRAEVTRAIAQGKYPSPPARDLSLVTKGRPSGVVRDFMLWTLTDGQRLVRQTGYVELPADRLAEARQRLR